MNKLILMFTIALLPLLAIAQQTGQRSDPDALNQGATWVFTIEKDGTATITDIDLSTSTGFDGTMNVPGNVVVGGNLSYVVNAIGVSGAASSNFVKSDITGLDFSNASNLTIINKKAFYQCSNLTGNLVLPTGTSCAIGESAFGWSNLTGDLFIPANITAIGSMAFIGCESLRSITFGSTTLNMDFANMGLSTFAQCTSMEYIDMSSCTLGTPPQSISRDMMGADLFEFLPAHTVVYLPKDNAAGDMIRLLSSLNATFNVNFVFGASDNPSTGTCAWFYVCEGSNYYLPYGFIANKATYSSANAIGEKANTFYRTFTGPTSVYLPYTFKADNGASSVGVYRLSYYDNHSDDDATDNTFVFKKQATGTDIFANTPYIVRVDGGNGKAQLPDGVNVTVPASPTGYYHSGTSGTVFTDGRIPMYVPSSDGKLPSVKDNANVIWTLTGTTEMISNATATANNTWYFGRDGKWYSNKSGSLNLNPFRVFLVPNSNTAAMPLSKFSFVDELGNATGIGTIDNKDEELIGNSVETRIYTIGGQYVSKDFNSLPKGIYIVNGKKIMK